MSRWDCIVVIVITCVLLQRSCSVHGSPVIVKRLSRPDPLNHFKTYRGGYDTGNKHYWASAAFTGIHGYATAAIWLLIGIVFGGYLLTKNCICKNNSVEDSVTIYPDASYIILFTVVLIFALLALMTSGLTITANEMSVQRTKTVKETLFKAGDDVQQTIEIVTAVFRDMEIILRPYKRKTCQLLNVTSERLLNGSREIQSFVYHSRHSSKGAVQAVYIANLVVVSIDMALFIAAVVLLFVHWHPGFIIIIFFCWVFATVSWMMTGFDFFYHTFIEDTCATFRDFRHNPQNSSLKSMLSCADSSAADTTLLKIGQHVHKFISELNAKITTLQQLLISTGQDYVLGVSEICDPFPTAPSYRYKPEHCPDHAVSISDIPELLSKFTCYKGSSILDCEENGRFLSEATYNKAWAYSQSTQDLINVYPYMERLTRCSSIEEAISDIVLYQCGPLKMSVMMLWSFMLSLSIVMIVLILVLILKAFQDRGETYSRCSILPDDDDS